ncbi:MAG: benzoyl-CoA 2,3-epoxidase subunit BoxB, partial [Planctomycetota bacterium]
MATVDLNAKIPNNVGLADDRRLLRALERWLPLYLEWWNDMGPTGFQSKDIYLRTAISVEAGGWAHFEYVKMPDYRWGIFLTPHPDDRKIGFGDHWGRPVWQDIPGEYRGNLRRIIVTQADTEPASVEQQRFLGSIAPSLYDMRNLFQVNVEEGRHLWAMVYLLFRYFGKDGRDEAEELLARRSGDPDKPRILGAFNQPCDHWLSFFAFTHFTDRDGKYQLASLGESGFDPLSRTCEFMLTEEAHHLFVGETGLDRVIRRSAELTKETDGDPRQVGGIDLDLVQRTLNYWFTYSLDLFGSEISSNASTYFSEGLKGRFKEEQRYEDHIMKEGVKRIPVVKHGRLVDEEVPYRNSVNEVLREEYMNDCERALRKWNRTLEQVGVDERLR